MINGLLPWLSNLLALTPHERFEAMRNLDAGGQGHSLLSNKWFILLGWSIIFILLMILVAIRQQRHEKGRKQMLMRFEEQANKFELTVEEREVLFLISQYARLRQASSIFALQNAFEKGTAVLLKKQLGENSDEQTARELNRTIEMIKEKIGFVGSVPVHGGRFRGGRYMTSRQIAVGKTVSVVTSAEGQEVSTAFEAQVTANEQEGLKLQMHHPLLLKPGEACMVQAQFGAVLWGFEMVVLLCRGTDLELHHVDQARYLNRRRFVRVPVHKPALIAPFSATTTRDVAGLVKPMFYPAEVKELSGPGLRLRVDLEVEVRDRLLVIFELERGKVIQDMAEVRRVSESVAGRTVAVELIGLTDAIEDELIRLTNQMAIQQGIRSSEAGSGEAAEEAETREEVTIS